MLDSELIVAAARISIPYTLAALAGILSERSGTVNIALEGMMLVGAFGAVLGTLSLGSPVLGLLTGILAGLLLALLHAIVTGVFRADHIVSGLALNLLAQGLTRVLLRWVYHSTSNSPRAEGLVSLVQGNSLWALLTHPLFYLTLALVALCAWMLEHTVLGLRLKAVGEHPSAALAAGIPVGRLRATGVLMSGALAGLSGVWLAFDQHQFSDGMSGGRGYIALAAMILGRWRPLAATLACLLFGTAEALQISLQGRLEQVPVQLVQALPYLLTLIVLTVFSSRRLSHK